jgi:hypothetical protein
MAPKGCLAHLAAGTNNRKHCPFFQSGLTKRIALRSSVGMDLISSFIRGWSGVQKISHRSRFSSGITCLFVAADIDASPCQVVVRFAQARIALKVVFVPIREVKAVNVRRDKGVTSL